MNTGKRKTNFLDKYERKGRLMKKSMTTDKFKERYFILERHHLCYFKEKSKSQSYNFRGQKFKLNYIVQS